MNNKKLKIIIIKYEKPYKENDLKSRIKMTPEQQLIKDIFNPTGLFTNPNRPLKV
jgi:hypothetical protein